MSVCPVKEASRHCGAGDQEHEKPHAKKPKSMSLKESPISTRRANRAGFGTAVYWAAYLTADGWSPSSVQDITGLPWSTVRKVFAAHPERARQWAEEL